MAKAEALSQIHVSTTSVWEKEAIVANKLDSLSGVRVAVELLDEFFNEEFRAAVVNAVVAEARGFNDPYHFVRDLVRDKGMELKRYELMK